MKLLAWVATLAGAAVPAATARALTQSPQSTAIGPACETLQHRQFDFWIGEWNVTAPDGRLAGSNAITPILKGCVLHEKWQGTRGGSGESFNAYDAAAGKWRQTWVADDGVVLLLEGGLSEGAMTLSGRRPSSQKPGVIVTDRITWTPLSDGGVRQFWEVSEDGGTSWRVEFDGRYRRRR